MAVYWPNIIIGIITGLISGYFLTVACLERGPEKAFPHQFSVETVTIAVFTLCMAAVFSVAFSTFFTDTFVAAAYAQTLASSALVALVTSPITTVVKLRNPQSLVNYTPDDGASHE